MNKHTFILAIAILLNSFICKSQNSTNESPNGGKLETISISDKGDNLLQFQVKTTTYGGSYGPRHVFAIWIVDASNQYVTSLKVQAAKYKKKLNKWETYSGGTIPSDAVSGASLTAHQTHTVTWNGKNTLGNLVPDGNYSVYVEFNETNNLSGNPYISVPFTKGSSSQTLTPASNSFFQNMILNFYAPTSIGIFDDSKETFSISPNPASDRVAFTVNLKAGAKVSIEIFSLSGKKVHAFQSEVYDGGTHVFYWYPNDFGFNNGIFVAKCMVNNQMFSQKIVVK